MKNEANNEQQVLNRFSAFELLPDEIKDYSERVAHNSQLLFVELIKQGLYSEYIDLNLDNAKHIYEAVKYFDIGFAIKNHEGNQPDIVLPIHHVKAGPEIFFADVKKREDFKALSSEEKFIRRIAKEAASYHHEKWDGSGYPIGLKMEEIPLIARICGLCLAFEEYTSGKASKKKLGRYDAMKNINELSSIEFDPILVDVFSDILSEFAIIGQAYERLTEEDIKPEIKEEAVVEETQEKDNSQIEDKKEENNEENSELLKTPEQIEVEKEQLSKKHRKKSRPVEMLFSPVKDMKNNKVIYHKADLIINDRYYGAMLPIIYEEVAEKTGKITDLLILGIEQVIEFIELADILKIEVNGVLIRMYGSIIEKFTNLVRITRIIEKSKIDPKRFIFEVPESILSSENTEVLKGVERLQKMGIRIAIRDFGTEYSSLFKLSEVNFDMVIISRKFLREITNNTKASGIVRGIIDMVKNMEVEEICEGVNREEQYEVLKKMGCRRMYGSFIGEPKQIKEYFD